MSHERPVPSHWRPRTAAGRRAVGGFVVALLLAQPPVVWLLANRIEPTVLGLPFLYAWLLGVYLVLVVILLRAWRAGL